MPDRLWAPWRMQYLEELHPEECVFCAAAKARDARKFKEYRVLASRPDEYVILNKYPYSFAHILVCPKSHVATLEELPRKQRCSFFELVSDAQAALNKAVKPQGLNLGMNIGKDAGAGIEEHLHMHLVPRWRGDTNFMPFLNDCSVIPAHLDQILETLLEHFLPLSSPDYK